MPDTVSLLNETEGSFKIWSLFFSLSVFCHILFFTFLVYQSHLFPNHSSKIPEFIQVDLLSLAGVSELTPAPEPAPLLPENREPDPPQPSQNPEPEPVAAELVPVAKAQSSDAPEPVSAAPPVFHKKPKSLKKKTYNPEKTLKSARNRLKDKVTQPSPPSFQENISKALRQIEKRVSEHSPPTNVVEGTGKGKYQKSGSIAAANALELYKAVISEKIQKNWAFPEKFVKDQPGLEVRLLIKILSDGDIISIIFDTKSGNRFLDDSALKAIKKSNPLPELPAGLDYYNVVLGFTPSGLR